MVSKGLLAYFKLGISEEEHKVDQSRPYYDRYSNWNLPNTSQSHYCWVNLLSGLLWNRLFTDTSGMNCGFMETVVLGRWLVMFNPVAFT